MKKVKSFLKSNLKVILAFIIGGTIVIGTKAETTFSSNQVLYNNTKTVDTAIDELYTKLNNFESGPIDPDTFKTNTAKTVYASKLGVCIERNNKLNCFKINNFEEERNHIKQVFSDVSCTVRSSGVTCSASDFFCSVGSSGHVRCDDDSDYSFCIVNSDGSVSCN